MPPLPVPRSTPKLPEKIFTAEQFGAAQGRALQDLGGSVGQLGGALQQRKTQREISTLNSELTKAQSELTVQWRETLRNADPEDDEVASRFMKEQVQTRLGAIKGSVSTGESRRHFDRLSSALNANFLVTTDAGRASLAETKAVSDFETSLNSLNDSVSADPLSFNTTIPMISLTLDGFQQSGGLSSDTRIKLETAAVRSAARVSARGLINQSPETAKELIDSGFYSEHITGEDKAQLLGFADSAIKSRDAAAERMKKAAAEARALDTVTRAINPDGSINTEELPVLQAENFFDPDADLTTAKETARFIDWLGTDAASTKINSPAVQNDLLRRASSQDLDVTEAMSFVGRGIDHSFLTNQLIPTIKRSASAEGRTANTRLDAHFKRVDTVLGLSGSFFSLPNPQATAAKADYQAAKTLEFQQGLEAGKTPSQLLDPGSPDFIGKDLDTFIPSSQPGVASFPIQRGPEFSPRFSPDTSVPGAKKRTPEELEALLNEGN